MEIPANLASYPSLHHSQKDFVDAERLVRRLASQELVLSFVPDSEQRLWRAVVRRKYIS